MDSLWHRLARPAVMQSRMLLASRLISSTTVRGGVNSWFVEKQPVAPVGVESTTPAPSTVKEVDLPDYLRPLHEKLLASELLRKNRITYINALEADPDSWCDWVVVCQVKRDEKDKLYAAGHEIKEFLKRNPIRSSNRHRSFAPGPAGLSTTPSKKQAVTEFVQSTGWCMLDANTVVVHIMSHHARAKWNLEDLWQNIARSNKSESFQLISTQPDDDTHAEEHRPMSKYDL